MAKCEAAHLGPVQDHCGGADTISIEIFKLKKQQKVCDEQYRPRVSVKNSVLSCVTKLGTRDFASGKAGV
jgi:hypothetical protein